MTPHWRETAITYASLGFLAGLILGLASCTPDCTPPPHPTTAVTQ